MAINFPLVITLGSVDGEHRFKSATKVASWASNEEAFWSSLSKKLPQNLSLTASAQSRLTSCPQYLARLAKTLESGQLSKEEEKEWFETLALYSQGRTISSSKARGKLVAQLVEEDPSAALGAIYVLTGMAEDIAKSDGISTDPAIDQVLTKGRNAVRVFERNLRAGRLRPQRPKKEPLKKNNIPISLNKFHSLLIDLKSELMSTKIVDRLSSLTDALTQISNEPSESSRAAFRTQLSEIYAILDQVPSNSCPPSRKKVLELIGATHVIGAGLKRRLENLFDSFGALPAELTSPLAEIHLSTEALETLVIDQIEILVSLGISPDLLEESEYELGMFLPQPCFDLKAIEPEFSFFEATISDLSELCGHGRPPIQLRTISSGSLFLTVGSTIGVALSLMKLVNMVLDAIKKYHDLKATLAGLEEKNLPAETTIPLRNHLETMLHSEIEAKIGQLVRETGVSLDQPRQNELINSLNMQANVLCQKLESGVTFEVAQPAEKAAYDSTAGEKPPFLVSHQTTLIQTQKQELCSLSLRATLHQSELATASEPQRRIQAEC